MKKAKKNNYKFKIVSNASVFEVLSDSYNNAIKKLKEELNIPPQFLENCSLERVSIIDISIASQETVK